MELVVVFLGVGVAAHGGFEFLLFLSCTLEGFLVTVTHGGHQSRMGERLD